MLLRRLALAIAVLAIVVLMAAPARAQLEPSRLIGTVRDAQRAVVPGVTVTATSPSLIGSQTAVTEASGSYRFPALPPGIYALTFELQGFKTAERIGIVLALNQTLTVDMQLEIATLEESVTVTGESPVLDTQSTTIGRAMDAARLTSIPTSTDIWAALSLAPGIRIRGFDVGGGHKSEQRAYEAFGIMSQSRIVTEGVDTTEGTGGSGFYQDYYSHEEIAVTAAGGDVTMNSPGAAVISSIKSGGNNFKSLTHLSYEREEFVGDNIDAATARRGFTGQPNLKFWEGHADLGGPIKRDKLWFFVALNRFVLDKSISGVPPSVATYQGFYWNFTTKGTFRATEKDTVIGYYQRGSVVTPFRTLSATVNRDASADQDSATWMYNGQHQRVWSNRLFTEFRVGLFGYYFPQVRQKWMDYRVTPPRIDLATGVQTGPYWPGFVAERNKPQVFGNLAYFLPTRAGNHDLKIGFEWLDDQQQFVNNGLSGPIRYEDRGGTIDQITLADFGDPATLGTDWTGAGNRNRRTALYFQDRWSPADRVTITAGIRYDYQRPYYMPSSRKPILSNIFPSLSFPRTTVLVRHMAAPRLGLSWDPIGDGKSVIKAFYGWFGTNLAQTFSGVNPGGTNQRTYRFLDQNGNGLYDGVHELGALVATSGGATTRIDPDILVTRTDEISLSYQRQLWGEASLRVAYVRKMMRDDYSTFNILREGQFTVPRVVTVTLRSFDQGVTESRSFTAFDIPDSLRGKVENVTANIPKSVGGGDYTYDTIQFAFNKRFEKGLFIDGSVDYLWRDELKDNSASTSVWVSDPLSVGYFQNVYPTVSNRQENTTWQARLSGRYVLPYGVGVGVNWLMQSGWPWARLITATLPNAGTQRFFMEDIKNNRSDKVSQVNLRVDKDFSLRDARLRLMFDVYNLLNANPVSNFNLLNGSRFNEIIAALDPITALVGIRFEF